MELILRSSGFAERPSAVVSPDSSFSECIESMTKNNGYVPILDQGIFVGIVTDGDIRRCICDKGVDNLRSTKACQLGSLTPFFIKESMINSFMRDLFACTHDLDHNIKHIPVLNEESKLIYFVLRHKVMAIMPKPMYSVEVINDLA